MLFQQAAKKRESEDPKVGAGTARDGRDPGFQHADLCGRRSQAQRQGTGRTADEVLSGRREGGGHWKKSGAVRESPSILENI